MLVAQLAIMANALVDTVMAGRLSAVDLAAVGIGASVYVSVFVTAMGVLLALSPIVAHLHGSGQHEAIGEEVRQSGWLALALTLIVLVVLTFPDPLLTLSRLQPEVEIKVRAYLGALAWSVPAQMAFRVFYGFSSGIGRPRPIMVLNLIGLALKVPLNLVFIYGHFGMPALGAPGCAVASSIVAWLICLLGWGWCVHEPAYRAYALFSRWSWPRWQQVRGQVQLGVPIGVTFFVDVTAFTFMALFIARLGPAASGGHQIAANMAAMLYMLPLAIGQSSGILAGHALGAGDRGRARLAGMTGLGIALLSALATSLLLLWLNRSIAGLYSNDDQVRVLAAQLIGIVAFYHLADAVQAVVVNLVRAYKKAAVPMLIYAVFLWGVGLAGGILLGLGDHFGPARGAPGFWISAASGMALAGVLVSTYWWRLSKP
jgi:MATE family multidrug resistance protein